MTDYSNWKVLKSVCNYEGDDPQKQAEAQAAQAEADIVNDWCNENHYMIDEDELYYFTAPRNPITHEDIRQMRIAYRREHIDDQTSERSRKQANNTWTTEDEAAYLALDSEVTAWIEENLPYPDNADDEVA